MKRETSGQLSTLTTTALNRKREDSAPKEVENLGPIFAEKVKAALKAAFAIWLPLMPSIVSRGSEGFRFRLAGLIKLIFRSVQALASIAEEQQADTHHHSPALLIARTKHLADQSDPRALQSL